ncbi:MAG: glycosyltransferase [Plectolyngbya sp. WJT66-NPBG17]|jgi:MGT family glycosyltransferase|nr:glycosyltransferase [Plectolyngbya sp. WJT66-NPBG17]MBW4526691.1 glycosyltransferase [Phormidium tanganyikae FI6-MK23]
MVHFGIICPPFFSHLHCFAALGRELRSRGHRVTFLQIPDVELTVQSTGLEFYPIGLESYVPGSLAATIAQLGQFSGIAALQYSAGFCQHLAEIVCQDAPSAIQEAGIDILLVDQLEPAGENVAQWLGLPFIGVCCSQIIRREAEIPPYFMGWRYQTASWAKLRNRITYAILDRESRSMLQVLNTYRKQWNLPLQHSLYTLQPSRLRLAQIIQQPLEFDFPWTRLPQNWHFVGPLRSPAQPAIEFPYDQLTGQPLVYASLGTLQNTKCELFDQIASACMGLDVQLVITLGGSRTAETRADLPGSPLVVQSAPQLEVLSRASLTITHGGLNTILDSLTHGVPLVAIPITYEQPGNGARIEWTGVGKAVPLQQLTVDRLRTAIIQVLTQESYRKNAQHLQQAIAQAGGVQRAANVVEQAIASPQSLVVPVR